MSKISQQFLETADDRAASAEADNAYLRDAMLDMAGRIESVRARLAGPTAGDLTPWAADALRLIALDLRIVAGEDAAKVAAAVAEDIEAGEIGF